MSLFLLGVGCNRKTSSKLSLDRSISDCPENIIELTIPCRNDTLVFFVENCSQIIDQGYEEGYLKIVKLNSGVSFTILCGSMIKRPIIDQNKIKLKKTEMLIGNNGKRRSGVMVEDSLLSWREDEYDKFSIFYFDVPLDKRESLDKIFDELVIE
jgi:hypothetical protein